MEEISGAWPAAPDGIGWQFTGDRIAGATEGDRP
jgi:hypothetical protein